MTSGDKKIAVSLAGEVRQEDFIHHHQDPSCDGTWGLLVQNNVPFPLSGLGAVLLPTACFVACPKCKAAFFLPGFQGLVEHILATNLVVNERILAPKEIKFLRLMFGLTQQEVIDEIEMESVSYYSKCETGKTGFAFSPDKQVRLKLLYATKLGISSAEDYHRISLTSGKREQPEGGGLLVDLEARLEPNVAKLAAAFKSKHRIEDLKPVKQG